MAASVGGPVDESKPRRGRGCSSRSSRSGRSSRARASSRRRWSPGPTRRRSRSPRSRRRWPGCSRPHSSPCSSPVTLRGFGAESAPDPHVRMRCACGYPRGEERPDQDTWPRRSCRELDPVVGAQAPLRRLSLSVYLLRCSPGSHVRPSRSWSARALLVSALAATESFRTSWRLPVRAPTGRDVAEERIGVMKRKLPSVLQRLLARRRSRPRSCRPVTWHVARSPCASGRSCAEGARRASGRLGDDAGIRLGRYPPVRRPTDLELRRQPHRVRLPPSWR